MGTQHRQVKNDAGSATEESDPNLRSNGKAGKVSTEGVDAEGKPTLVQFTANYDGKDSPYIGSPLWDTLALTPVDNFTTSFVQKKNGKVVLTGQRVVSKDGRTMTITGKGTSPTGQPTELALVFERR